MTQKEMQAITAAVVAALQGETTPAPEPAKKATRSRAKAKPKVAAACITAEMAWQLLGADENFRPKDGDKPATNAQLWRLNTAGRLSVS